MPDPSPNFALALYRSENCGLCSKSEFFNTIGSNRIFAAIDTNDRFRSVTGFGSNNESVSKGQYPCQKSKVLESAAQA